MFSKYYHKKSRRKERKEQIVQFNCCGYISTTIKLWHMPHKCIKPKKFLHMYLCSGVGRYCDKNQGLVAAKNAYKNACGTRSTTRVHYSCTTNGNKNCINEFNFVEVTNTATMFFFAKSVLPLLAKTRTDYVRRPAAGIYKRYSRID